MVQFVVVPPKIDLRRERVNLVGIAEVKLDEIFVALRILHHFAFVGDARIVAPSVAPSQQKHGHYGNKYCDFACVLHDILPPWLFCCRPFVADHQGTIHSNSGI